MRSCGHFLSARSGGSILPVPHIAWWMAGNSRKGSAHLLPNTWVSSRTCSPSCGPRYSTATRSPFTRSKKMLLCLYADAEAACPAHAHATRQLTLSLGQARTLLVDQDRYLMGHGDMVELSGQPHGVPPGAPEDGHVGPRVSVNFFFALESDLRAGPVSVNSDHDGAYAPFPKGPGACFMDEERALESVGELRGKLGRGWKHSPWCSGTAWRPEYGPTVWQVLYDGQWRNTRRECSRHRRLGGTTR